MKRKIKSNSQTAVVSSCLHVYVFVFKKARLDFTNLVITNYSISLERLKMFSIKTKPKNAINVSLMCVPFSYQCYSSQLQRSDIPVCSQQL